MDRIMMSGIYSITNKINDDRYIGSAICFKKRRWSHLHHLIHNKHHSIHLQNAFNKYGKAGFKFEILATCPKEYLIKLEQWFIDNLKPEYNILKLAYSSSGFKQSPETIEKLRQRQLNMSQETRDKIRKSLTGKKHKEEAKLKVSLYNKGKSKPIELRLKRSKESIKVDIELLKKVYELYNDGFRPIHIRERLNLTKQQISHLLDDNRNKLLKQELGLKKDYLWMRKKSTITK